MSLSPDIIAPVFVSDPDEKSIYISISIFLNEGAQIVDTFAFVDSRVTVMLVAQVLISKCTLWSSTMTLRDRGWSHFLSSHSGK